MTDSETDFPLELYRSRFLNMFKIWNILPVYLTPKIKYSDKIVNIFDNLKMSVILDNHGIYGWHIDHIIPQSKLLYDSMDHPNFQKCWALENLQPLWAKDNISKSNKTL